MTFYRLSNRGILEEAVNVKFKLFCENRHNLKNFNLFEINLQNLFEMAEEKYLLANHKQDILEILSHEDSSKCFPLNISFEKLCSFDVILGSAVIKEPETILFNLNSAVLKIQRDLSEEHDEKYKVKHNATCRIHSIHLQKFWRTLIRNEDSGMFLLVKGTVVRMSAAKLLEFRRQYVCVKCKYSTTVNADYSKRYMIKQPKKCCNPEGCNGTNLVAFGELDSDNCKDYQEIKLQEDISSLSTSLMPNTMWVTLEDDLVDSCKPGDSVSICGIVKQRWSELSKGSKIEIELCLKANHVEVTNRQSTTKITPEIRGMFDRFWEIYRDESLIGRDLILKSFCPELYGLYLVKLAVAVVLAGGSQNDQNPTGVRTRSESHLLLVGDPGTGKSQLLRFASKIISRSVLTTGVGSTSAGLTVTAIMENREWQLEAGALVLSDGGICCIDEFNSIKQHDRDSIHEAMEQQTISIAKAGIVCKLNSRCSILAACNPKGNLNLMLPLSMSVALPSPLLSRFDLILLIKDTVVEDWDSLLTEYILNGCKSCSKLTEQSLWNVETLQAYFAVIRKANPKLTVEANDILSAYYQMQRKLENRNKARTTVRLLDSLVRLSQGHARLMFHDKVEVCDSIFALILIDSAMEYDSAVLNLGVGTNMNFPDSSLAEYKRLVEIILNKLGLDDILERELAKIGDKVGKVVKSRFFHEKSSSNVPIFREGNNQITDNENLSESNEKQTEDICEEISGNKKSGSKEIISKNNITHRENLFSDINEDDLIIDSTPILQRKPSNSKLESSKRKSSEYLESKIPEKSMEKNKKFKFSKKVITVNLSDTGTTKSAVKHTNQETNIENNVIEYNAPSTSKIGIKEKLSKFKFVFKEGKEKDTKLNKDTPKDSENDKNLSKTKLTNEEKANSNENTKMLNLIPSVNDLRNIKIDFDCNFDRKLTQRSESSSSNHSENIRSIFENSGSIDDLDLEL